MSETTNLKLFKHDNPSTNTNEFNVDTALNQNWDKIDNFVGTVNGKILEIQNKDTEQDEKISSMQSEIEVIQEKDNVQDTKLAELQAENERLRKDINGLPSGQATAETIYLTDSAEMRFKKFGISGNSKQETRSEKNFLKNMATTQTINGITFTVNEDGTVTANGTATANAQLYVQPGTFNLEKGTYIMSGCPSGGAPETYYLGTNIMGSIWTEIGSEITLNLTEDVSNKNVVIVIKNGITVNNLVFKPMIRLSSADSTYEPYGASPSPDYPSEVESCGDNINILENIATSQEVNGLTVEVNDDKTVTINGTATQRTDITIGYVDFKTNINYVLSGTKNGKTNKWFLSIRGYGNDIGNGLSYTPTENTTKEIFIRVYEGITLNNQIFKPKVEKGSKATPYSPYGQGCINEVICNKNLCDVTTLKVSQVEEPIKINVKEESIYNLSFIKSRIAGATISTNTIYDIRTIRCFDENNNLLSQLTGTLYNMPSGSSISIKKQIETPKNTKYVLIYLGNNNGDNNVNTLVSQIQLEEGTATPYEEHQSQTYTIPTQQPFRAIGDIRDTFIKKNNKRFEKHWIFRKIFDGTENFNLLAQNFASDVLVDSIKFIDDNTIVYKSNYFKAIPASERNNPSDNSIWFNGAKRLFIHSTQFSTLNEFKTYLQEQYNAGTPVYVDYIAKTPLDIECTPEQNEILDKIEQEAHTYKNVTHIYSTDEVSPVNSIEYIKDIETLINKATTVVE